MSVAFAVPFSALFLEYDYSFTFQVVENFAYYFCSAYRGFAYLYVAVVVYQQHFVHLHYRALVGVKTVYIQFFASLGTELLSLNFYNCVH